MLTLTERAVALACARWAINMENAEVHAREYPEVARECRQQARPHAGRAMALVARLEREAAR